MFSKNYHENVLKIISVLVAGIFLWHQIAWAGDFVIANKDVSMTGIADDPVIRDAGEIIELELQKESLISNKQAIEDFQKEKTVSQVQLDSTNDPEPVSHEYDNDGRIIKTLLSDGSFLLFEYYGNTTNVSKERYYLAGWAWQYSNVYWEDTPGVLYQKCISGSVPDEDGDWWNFLYDRSGRIVKKYDRQSNFKTYEYYGNTTNVYKEKYYLEGWLWQYSNTYWEAHPGILEKRWVVDRDQEVDGDYVGFLYDEAGRIRKKYFDNDDFVTIDYYGDTQNVYIEAFYGPDWVWKRSFKYWESLPGVVQYENIAEETPEADGEVVFREYNNLGRIIKEKYDNDTSKYFYYYESTENIRYIEYFLSDGTIFMREQYDEKFNLIATTSFYSDGVINEVRRTDGSWEKYDTLGMLVERGEMISGVEVVYDSNERIVRLIDGLFEEARQYTISDGEVLYTQALHNGIVKAVVDNYCTSTDIISKEETSSSGETVSVTYEGNITAAYAGADIKSISVEEGYMNFYSGEDIVSQTSARGDLYSFEDNFLKRVATVSGNIYNFTKEESDSGFVVKMTDAVINGARYEFSDSVISAIYDGDTRISIEDLTILNGPKIGTLAVNRGNGSEVLCEDDPLFVRVQEVLDTIYEEVPNIKFDFTEDLAISKIVTSNYSTLEFDSGLISKTVSAEGVEVGYEYEYDTDGGIAGLKMMEETATRIFDKTGQLLSVEFANGKRLAFENGALSGLETDGDIFEHINFDEAGELEKGHLINAEGEEYLFAGKKVSEFINSDNCRAEYDDNGNLKKVTRIDIGEVYEVCYSSDPDTQQQIITFTSSGTNVEYVYKNGFLYHISDPSGIEVVYSYDENMLAEKVYISYGGVRNSTYTFDYSDDGSLTMVTDDLGNIRSYDENNNIVSLKTPYSETYHYVHSIDQDGKETTMINYTYKKNEDTGVITEYFKGKIQKITKPDGTYIDNISFDESTGKLKEFSFHTPDGKHRNVILQGELVQFEMEDSTRLVFHDKKLVAFAGSQGIVPLCDLEDLRDLMYGDDEEQEYQPVSVDDVDIAASQWKHQTYGDSQAIHFVERDYVNDQWELNVNLKTGDADCSKGEMYLDLRYDIPGLEYQAPVDMTGKEISFIFKPDSDFAYDPYNPCNIQVFVKDKNWNTQYGPEVEVHDNGNWIEVKLVPTQDEVNFGYTDPGFDPANIVMIGLRVAEPDNVPSGRNYSGKIFLKHQILPDLFENVNFEDNPLDDLYYGLGLERDLDLLDSENTPEEIAVYLENFASAIANGPSNDYQQNLLRYVNWGTETDVSYMQGIKSIYRDVDSDEFILDVDMCSNDVVPGNDYQKGGVSFDVRKDIPGFDWGSPLNLVKRPIRILVCFPEGMIGTGECPNGANLFVKDIYGNIQTGTWINIDEAHKWYQLELTPSFGEIPEGETDQGFDPSQIVNIGVDISTTDGSSTDFEGQVKLKFMPENISSDPGDVISMPSWMDLRGLKEYIVDGNNRIRVPWVNYIPEEYFSYVFNLGSGEAPAVDFDVLEKPNTDWQVQKGVIVKGLILDSFENGEEVWQKLIEKGWIVEISKEGVENRNIKAEIQPASDRPSSTLGSGIDAQQEDIEEVLKSCEMGIRDVYWDTSGESLILDLNMDSAGAGENFLDVRYNSYVPDANWQDNQLLDMSDQQIIYKVRPKDGFSSNTSSPLQFEAFMKSIRKVEEKDEDGNVINKWDEWNEQYSTKVNLEEDGWTTITISPTPGAFTQGFTSDNFDPTKIASFGLRVLSQSDSYEYTGQLEVQYEIVDVSEGLFGPELGDNGTIPSHPVWVDQQGLADFLTAEGIELFCDMDILAQATKIAEEIPEHQLQSDFAAFMVYDENDKITQVSKSNGTTTYFDDNGKMDFITFENGNIFVDYEYDENGDLAKATLVNARAKLETAVSDIVAKIEKQTTDALLVLAEQKDLIGENYITTVVTPERQKIAAERARLNSMRWIVIEHSFLWWSWEERIENPSVVSALNQLAGMEAAFEATVSEELEKLDASLQEEKEKIKNEKKQVLDEYTWQEKRIFLGILREEALPIFHYYYRNVLGRDATEEEIEAIYKRVDENESFSGFFEEDILDLGSLILNIQQDSDSPVYQGFSENIKTFISEYVSGDEIDDATREQLFKDLDSIVMDMNLYDSLVSYYYSDEEVANALTDIKDTYFTELTQIEEYEQQLDSDTLQREEDIQTVKESIEEYAALKQELIDIVNDSTFNYDQYNGYWKDFLYEYYRRDSGKRLVIRNNVLYVQTGWYYKNEDPVTGFLPEVVYDLDGYGYEMENKTIVIAQDLGDISGLQEEIEDYELYLNGYLYNEKERINNLKKEHYWWINRYALQYLYQDIRIKDKDSPKFTAASLREELLDTIEYQEAVIFKDNVTAGVMNFIEEYFENPDSRAALLSELGLTEDEVINITDKFLLALRDWLEKQDMHFGKSAFGALKEMIDQNGGSADLEEVSQKALLVDILTGTSGPMTDDKISISMYSMSLVAGLYGVSCVNARLSYEDILLTEDPFVTLINGNHYVTVLSVDQDQVIYWDQNDGSTGGERTLSREDFENYWQGNVIIADQSLAALRTAVGEENINILDAQESKKIKGAFFGFIIAAIVGLCSFATTVVTVAINIIITIMAPLVTFIGEIAAGLAHAIVNIGSMLGSIGQAFMGSMGAGAGTASSGGLLGSLVSTPSAVTLLKMGAGYITSIGLDMMGVDPLVGGIVSNILTGGATGLLDAGGSLGGAFKSMIEIGLPLGSRIITDYVDLDPMVESILGLSIGAIGNGLLDPDISFGDAIGELVKDVAGSLVGYGVQYVGMELGLDPSLSYLAGIGIRSSLQAGLGLGLGQGGGSPGDNFLGFDLNLAEQAFRDTLKSELPYLALGWISSQTGLDPSILNQLAPTMEALIAPIIDARTPGEAISNTWNMLDRVSAVALDMIVTGAGQLAELISPENIWDMIKNSAQSIMDSWNNILQTADEFIWGDDLFDWGSGALNGGDEVLQMVWDNRGDIVDASRPWFNEFVELGIADYEIDMVNKELEFMYENKESIFYNVINNLVEFKSPEIISNADGTMANIDLNLTWPVSNTSLYEAIPDLTNLLLANCTGVSDEVLSLMYSSDMWDLSTSLDAMNRVDLFNAGYNFVFGGGINSDGLISWSEERQEYDFEKYYEKLDTNQRINLGFSASTVGALKYMLLEHLLVPPENKADVYIFESPQFSSDLLQEILEITGIPAEKIIIVETVGDKRRALGGDFSDNRNTDGTVKWNYVKILDGPGVSLWNSFSSHTVPIDGFLADFEYEVEVNGNNESGRKLSDYLHEIIEE